MVYLLWCLVSKETGKPLTWNDLIDLSPHYVMDHKCKTGNIPAGFMTREYARDHKREILRGINYRIGKLWVDVIDVE